MAFLTKATGFLDKVNGIANQASNINNKVNGIANQASNINNKVNGIANQASNLTNTANNLQNGITGQELQYSFLGDDKVPPNQTNSDGKEEEVVRTNRVDIGINTAKELIQALKQILKDNSTIQFSDIIREELKVLLTRYRDNNYEKISNILDESINNLSMNFLKTDQFISKKFFGNLLKNNKELFQPIFMKNINNQDNIETIVHNIKKDLCKTEDQRNDIKNPNFHIEDPIILTEDINDNMIIPLNQDSKPEIFPIMGSSPLSIKQIDEIIKIVSIYLKPDTKIAQANSKILDEVIIPVIKNSLESQKAEREIYNILIPNLQKFTTNIFSILLNTDEDNTKKQFLLLGLNHTCTTNNENTENKDKFDGNIEEAFKKAIEKFRSINLNKEDEIYDNITNYILNGNFQGGKPKRSIKKKKTRKSIKKKRTRKSIKKKNL